MLFDVERGVSITELRNEQRGGVDHAGCSRVVVCEPRAAWSDRLTGDAGSDEHGSRERQDKRVEHVRDEHREREEVPQNALFQFVELCLCVSTYAVMPERVGHGADAGEPLEERGAWEQRRRHTCRRSRSESAVRRLGAMSGRAEERGDTGHTT